MRSLPVPFPVKLAVSGEVVGYLDLGPAGGGPPVSVLFTERLGGPGGASVTLREGPKSHSSVPPSSQPLCVGMIFLFTLAWLAPMSHCSQGETPWSWHSDISKAVS